MINKEKIALEKTLEVKSRDPGGGSFFQVILHGKVIDTIWGRSEKEVIDFLLNFQQRNKKYIDSYSRKPFPGNKLFTSIRKLR
jgi:hypothetical protein